jgi:hypothetical protein
MESDATAPLDVPSEPQPSTSTQDESLSNADVPVEPQALRDAPVTESLDAEAATTDNFEQSSPDRETPVEEPTSAEPSDVKVLPKAVSIDMPQLPEGSRSVLAKILNADLVANLGSILTNHSVTIFDCIKSAISNPDASSGVYAGDSECYSAFSGVFTPVLDFLHPYTRIDDSHPHGIPSDLPEWQSPDPESIHVVNVRVMASRNLNVRPF